MNTLIKKMTAIVIALSLIPAIAVASPFKSGAKYKIVSNDRGSGAIGLGAYHGSDFQIYYVDNDADISNDCWWYFDDMGNNNFVVRNAQTGQCLQYTSKSQSGVYSNLTLSDESEATHWKLTASPMLGFVFSIQADITRYMRLGPKKEGTNADMVKVDKYAATTLTSTSTTLRATSSRQTTSMKIPTQAKMPTLNLK